MSWLSVGDGELEDAVAQFGGDLEEGLSTVGHFALAACRLRGSDWIGAQRGSKEDLASVAEKRVSEFSTACCRPQVLSTYLAIVGEVGVWG